MKYSTCSLLAAVAVLTFAFFDHKASADIKTVPSVDVNRFLGDWYQIAHIPLWFEGGENCACARQRLKMTSVAGTISVNNSCTRDDGKLASIAGTATADDAPSFSKFTVSFAGVPIKGSYWIIGLDTDYRYAVVTDKDGYSLYILSKSPSLDAQLYVAAIKQAKAQVDVSKVVMTRQTSCSYPD